jgi:hypothetical protein
MLIPEIYAESRPNALTYTPVQMTTHKVSVPKKIAPSTSNHANIHPSPVTWVPRDRSRQAWSPEAMLEHHNWLDDTFFYPNTNV